MFSYALIFSSEGLKVIAYLCLILVIFVEYYENLGKIMQRLCRFGEGYDLGTRSLPLEDQYRRINEHNIRKLGINLREIQGGCPPSLTLKGSQRILMRSPPAIRVPEAAKQLKEESTQSLFTGSQVESITIFKGVVGSCSVE